jgi:phosphopantetheinyl transferase (holo-ACP synthase)
MTNPIIKLHNIETGEIVEREMNTEELAQWEADQEAAQAAAAEAADKEAARQALLEKLGITADEAKLLLG